MMRLPLITLFVFSLLWAQAQSVAVNPTISPALFQTGSTITVTYDVTGTPLSNLSNAWIWVWIPGQTSIDAKYNITPATAAQDPAKFTKSVESGRTLFRITFKPSDFFVQDISTQTKMGMLLKGIDWANGQTTDYLASIGYKITLNAPLQNPLFVESNSQIFITATAPIVSEFKLFVNDVLVNTQPDITSYSYVHTATEQSGASIVRLQATASSDADEISFQYIISAASPAVPRPTGIIPGINYHSEDETKATLCLWAPGKTTVHLRGEFIDWSIELMNRDGEFFWKEITGLVPQQEYAFQYLVEESTWVADPYADKILDPDDQYITNDIYPNLKEFPSEALNAQWYFNRLSVLQTGQQSYAWQVENFEKPAKEKLVVYEVLIRDFFEWDNNTYQSMIDTISYFKRLGVNAIELMPIMEFGGNNSWGYNPQFMFAPDKAYGPKNKLKEFVDACHQNGIAVILDIAMNHQDMPNPYVMMDFNFTTFVPTANNKWFNTAARHPFNVFFDMNHESTYTKAYLDTVNHYWLNEYKVDGFRFDLSKGFTQVNNPNDVNAWSAYDASRIALLKRMADKIWEHTPDALVVLEHLSANSEEKELAEYRADEGKGMLLWGNMNHAYRQNAMGFSSGSDIGGTHHQSRSWTVPHLVSYMESHDEERMVFSNKTSGAVSGPYNTRLLPTALDRAKAAATIFYTVPGPKMLWQFGELGYDYSINTCEDGITIDDDCRTYPKPVVWEYQANADRNELFEHVRDLIHLRTAHDVFSSGDATFSGGSALKKQLTLKNKPYTDTPTSAEEMNAVVVVNFDVTEQSVTVTFPHAGNWYKYHTKTQIQVSGTSRVITMKPGEYILYTDVPLSDDIVTEAEYDLEQSVELFPNPVENVLTVQTDLKIKSLSLYSLQGIPVAINKLSDANWDLSKVSSGLYLAKIVTQKGTVTKKLLKR